MQLVLRANVDGLGRKGEVVDVAPGYARNYLVPKGLAMKATPGGQAQADAMRRSASLRDAADRAAAEEIARTLVGQVIAISARAGAGGKLFGSITVADIIEAVEAQSGVVLERRHLALDEPIKSIGEHSVTAKLHSDVQFQVALDITAD
jgi:large subunit ribosomal protein L9